MTITHTPPITASPIVTAEDQVSCEGRLEAQGHPKVYLYLSRGNVTICPYCSQHFVLDKKPTK